MRRILTQYPRLSAVVFAALATTGVALAQQASQVGTLDGHTDPVYAVAWTPDGKTLATGGFDNTVRLWDAATRKEIKKYEGHANLVLAVAACPGRQDDPLGQPRQDGQDLGIPPRRADEGARRATPPACTPWPSNPTASRPRRHPGRSSRSGTCRPGRRYGSLKGTTATSNQRPGEATVRRSRPETRPARSASGTAPTARPRGSSRRPPIPCSVSPTSRTTSSSSRPVPTASPDSGNCRSSSPRSSTPKADSPLFALSPDGSKVATGGDDKIVRIWNAADGSLVKEIDAAGEPVIAIGLQGRRHRRSPSDSRTRRPRSQRRTTATRSRRSRASPRPPRPWPSGPTGRRSPRRPTTTRSGSSTSVTAKEVKALEGHGGRDQRPGVPPERRQPPRLGLGRQDGEALEHQRRQVGPRLRRPRRRGPGAERQSATVRSSSPARPTRSVKVWTVGDGKNARDR